MCVRNRIEPRQVDVQQLQRTLLNQGQSLFYFRDVIPSTPHFTSIQRIGMAGVYEGYEDFTYRPERLASLGDVAKQLFHALKLPVKMDYTDLWKIMSWIPANHPKGWQHCTPHHWATYYIMTLWNRGACTDEELKAMNPDAPATRLQLAGWAAAAIGTTEGKRDLLQRELAAGSATFTRAELADFIVNLTNVGSA
jgi:hypothetical protein